MKRLAQITYPDPTLRTEFMASLGFFTNMFSFFFAIFGTSYFLRKIGLKWSLLTFALSILVTLVCSHSDSHTHAHTIVPSLFHTHPSFLTHPSS